MNKAKQPVKVTILDKDYLINCTEEEKKPLLDAVAYLNKKTLETKKNSGVIGSERIAVMTALNITDEFLTCKQQNSDYNLEINMVLKRLHMKLDSALTEEKRLDA